MQKFSTRTTTAVFQTSDISSSVTTVIRLPVNVQTIIISSYDSIHQRLCIFLNRCNVIFRTLLSTGKAPIFFCSLFYQFIDLFTGGFRVFSLYFLWNGSRRNTCPDIMQNITDSDLTTFLLLENLLISQFCFIQTKRTAPHRNHIDTVRQWCQISLTDRAFGWPVTKPSEKNGTTVILACCLPCTKIRIILCAFFVIHRIVTTDMLKVFAFYIDTRRKHHPNNRKYI